MRNWTIDLVANTATHESGLVILFEPAADVDGAWDGRAISEIPAALPRDAQALARLMRDAGDAFTHARKGNP